MIDVFTASGCHRCQSAKDLAQSASTQFGIERVEWQELGVVDNIDYAVQLKLLSAPALVINGEKIFTSIPSQPVFFDAIKEYLKG